MKVMIGLVTALAVVSTVHSAPHDKAKEQHSFHFYNKAATQNDQLERELIARVMQDDPSIAELQGWLDSLTNAVKKYGPTALEVANGLVNRPKVQMEDESQDDPNAKEQHSFHFYNKAAKQNDELKRELIARVMQGDPSIAELQGWLDSLTNAVKKYGPTALEVANGLVNGGKVQVEDEPQDDLNAKEQHSFQ